MAHIDLPGNDVLSNPQAGSFRVYYKNDGLPYFRDSSGTETAFTTGGSLGDFLPLAGGTMTGPLIVNADAAFSNDVFITTSNGSTPVTGKVLGAADGTGLAEWIDTPFDAVNSAISSGVLTGGLITVNAGDPAKIDVSAGTGVIWDWISPGTPGRTLVEWDALVGVTLTNIGTSIFTSLYFDVNGVLQQNGGFIATPQQRRQGIVLQEVSHTQNTIVESITTSQNLAYQATESIMDWIRAIGAVNSGNTYKANGANLFIDKVAGSTTFPWINSDVDLQNPAIKTNGGGSAINLLRSYSDGSGGHNLDFDTDINPDVYDNGSGILATVGNNKVTNRFFFFFGATNMTVIVMGNTQYANQAEAISSATNEFSTLDIDPILVSGRITTVLSVAKGTTDLTNTSDAQFTIAVGLVGGGISTGLTIGDTISGSTANRVLYTDASNTLADSANMTFDGTNLSLGGAFNLTGTTTTQAAILFENQDSYQASLSWNSAATLLRVTESNVTQFQYSEGTSTGGLHMNTAFGTLSSVTDLSVDNNGYNAFIRVTGDSGVGPKVGQVNLQAENDLNEVAFLQLLAPDSASPGLTRATLAADFIDLVGKLDLTGDFDLSGDVTTSGTFIADVADSTIGFAIENTSNNNVFRVQTDSNGDGFAVFSNSAGTAKVIVDTDDANPLTVVGGIKLATLPAGTPVMQVGVDASGNLIKFAL